MGEQFADTDIKKIELRAGDDSKILALYFDLDNLVENNDPVVHIDLDELRTIVWRLRNVHGVSI